MKLDSRLNRLKTVEQVAIWDLRFWLNLAPRSQPQQQLQIKINALVLGAGLLIAGLAGCGTLRKETADAQQQPGAEGRQGATPVDVAIARTGSLKEELEYTGTTAPVQEVTLRSRVEGQIQSLNVDVGDAVKQGQNLGELDDNLLRAALNEAEAELASLKAEVASARNQVSNVRAEVERARLEQQQAQADAQRQQKLAGAGAVATQAAEQAQTTAQTATQAVRAAQEQVQTQQQAVTAAQSRVSAQQAVVAQAREQLSYAQLQAPITGRVTQRLTEVGNFIQPNGEIIRIGDFSRAEVMVEVSELELVNIRVGQPARVKLDAFPGQITGQVTRISPAADATARLVPIEVVIPNSDGKIGSGLLARVSFTNAAQPQVVVPETAITSTEQQASKGTAASSEQSTGTVFIVTGDRNQAKVAARAVKLGERADGQVEILAGLQPGERFVAQSGRPLKDGETVGLSILSETQAGGQN